MSDESLTLVVRRTIHASPEELFAAWTEPEQLKQWWGPRPITCAEAEIDLRVGGTYRIANRMADGSLLWIAGEFEVIEPPCKIVYTWRTDPTAQSVERVMVEFKARGDVTDVIITHQRIPDSTTRSRHDLGWSGCLDGLVSYLSGGRLR